MTAARWRSQLKFNSIEDFEPGRVAEQVPALKALLETRNKLRDLMSKVDRSEQLESLLEQILKNESELKSLSGELGLDKTGGLSHFRHQRRARDRPGGRRRPPRAGGLLEQVVAATKQTEPDRAQELVKTLVEQALAGTVTFDRNLPRTIDKAIAAIDAQALGPAQRDHAQRAFPAARRQLARARTTS